MAYREIPAEREMKRLGWFRVVRSSDEQYLKDRAKEIHQQGWETSVLPYGRSVKTLFARPQEAKNA